MSDDKQIAEAFGGGTLPTAFSPQALIQSTANLPKTSDKPYLSFKDGEWTFGQDAAECDPEALWAVNPNSFQFGLIEWFDGTAGGELLVPAGTPYNAGDLVLQFDPNGKDRDGKPPRIAPQIAVDLYCANGDDEGVQVMFKTSTRGGVDALNNLAQAIAKQGATETDEIVAIVTLESSSYMHKHYKRKTYVPILKLQGFDNFDLDNTKAHAEDGGDDVPPPAANKRSTGNGKAAATPPPARTRRKS